MRSFGWAGSQLASTGRSRELAGTQQGLDISGWCRALNQSIVHSQTFPAISNSPYPFGGKAPTGEVLSKPSAHKFCQGNSPCQVFAIWHPFGVSSVPQTNSAPSNPPRAANSRLVTAYSSIHKPPIVTLWTGASSG